MAKKSITIKELAADIRAVDTLNMDVWKAMREFSTKLDEKFFKSSMIDIRGDFLEMCGMERN